MSTDLHSLCGAYAVDALDEDERPQFEDHLAHCPHCSEELTGLLQAATAISAVGQLAPPPELRANVLAQIRLVRPLPPLVQQPPRDGGNVRTPVPEPARAPGPLPSAGDGQPGDDLSHARSDRLEKARAARRTTTRWLALAAAAVVILVAGGVAWHPWTYSTGQTTPQSAVQQVLGAKDATTYHTKIGSADAVVVRSASLHKAVVRTTDLRSAPSGHVYALWYFDAKGQPVKAGKLPNNTSGTTTTMLTGNAANAKGVGITIEKASGWTKPTTRPILDVSFA